MNKNRAVSEFDESVLKQLEALHGAIDGFQWSCFAKACELSTARLEDLIKRRETVSTTTLLRIAVFLEFVGYPSKLASTEKRMQDFAYIYAVGQIPIKDLLPNDNERENYFRSVRGLRGITSAALQSIERVLSEKYLVLQQLPLKKQFVIAKVFGSKKKEGKQQDLEPHHSVGDEEEFRRHVIALHALCNKFIDGNVPESKRDTLRVVVGQRNIFDLKGKLALLCGATAFKTLQRKGRTE